MKSCILSLRHSIRCLILVSLIGCATTDSKPSSLELTFDGEGCVFNGPTQFKSGTVTLQFINNSEGQAAANLVRHAEGHGHDYMLNTFGEEPSTAHHPEWTTEIVGVWKIVEAGESHTWEGTLEPSNYTLVSARMDPFGVWYGAGLTVEE